MTEASQDRFSPLANALGESFQAGWRQVVAADSHEPSLDRLAACAEGRLTSREEASVAREIASSPAALEILAALMEENDLPRRFPSLESVEVHAPTITRLSDEKTSPQGRHTQLVAWAVAASLAVAAWGLVASRNLRQEVAAVSNRADRAMAALLLSKKEEVAVLAQRERSPYVVGASSPELTALAVEALHEQLSGGSRAADFPDPEEIAALEQAQDGLYAAAREFKQAGLEGELEFIAALIQSGRLDEASESLAAMAGEAARSPSRAQWQNLRGTLLAMQAAESSLRVAEPLLTEAATLLRQSAEGGVAQAWLNLALVYAEQDEVTKAEDALKRYQASQAKPAAAEPPPQN